MARPIATITEVVPMSGSSMTSRAITPTTPQNGNTPLRKSRTPAPLALSQVAR